jgi:hypothetical protein
MLLWAALAAAVGGGAVNSAATARADDADPIKEISAALPKGWSVDIESVNGHCWIYITTAEMQTKASMYGQAYPFPQKAKLDFWVQLLPRYSQKMWERIKAHNKPIHDKLHGLNYYSKEYQETARKLIDEPMFFDKNYGYRVRCPSFVPGNAADAEELVATLKKFTGGWKSYDPEKTDVIGELREILTK